MDRLLTRVLPEQVSEAWDFVAPAIADSLPPVIRVSETAMVNVLSAVLEERATVWLYKKEGELAALLLTTLYREPVMHAVHVIIYSIYSFIDLDQADWEYGVDLFQRYAEGIGAQGVIAFSDLPGVVQLAKRIGANTDFHLIQF